MYYIEFQLNKKYFGKLLIFLNKKFAGLKIIYYFCTG